MLVSVAMITYNHEKYVKDALEGILMQDVDFDYEIVIGEDASTDNTAKILKQYQQKYPNKFKITFHQGNVGMMNNFIQTLNSCTGKYIALCEGDDYWIDSKKLQVQIDFLENNEDFVGSFHNVLIKDERYNREMKPWRLYDRDVFELGDTFSQTALFHTCSYVFRQSALENPEWFKDVSSGDMALFAITAAKGKIKRIDGDMGVYRKVATGVTSDVTLIKYHRSRIQLMSFFLDYFDKKYSKQIKKLIKFHKKEIKSIRIKSLKKRLKLT